MSLLAKGIILYVENPKASKTKWAKLISEFSEVLRFKVHIKNQFYFCI